jgi:hypothetical protein
MHKSIRKSSKLTLDRQAIRNLRILAPQALGQVQGASNDPMCSLCQNNSCIPR